MFAVNQTTLAVHNSDDRFPVRRVYCVGRNYADHAREMGSDPDREPPFFFSKPRDAAFTVAEGIRPELPGVVPYPPLTGNLHHEVELVVALGSGGSSVTPEHALDLVWGYGVGVDLTRRDLQDVAKKTGRPWETAKGFDASAPLGLLAPVTVTGHPAAGRISLSVNGEIRQEGDLAEQIWSVPEVISHVSGFVELAAGDLIMTGTPAGVGPLLRGDRVLGSIDGVGLVDFHVV